MTSITPEDFFDGATKTQMRRKLKAWFSKNQRDLPWRQKRTRYRIWVSEVMLQQTQVATVIDYFQRFVREFPNVKRLAGADEQQVLKLWEGLGYYRRARQMHAAAKLIVEKHAGKFPEQFADVLALPGIGRYTAGAILSIADEQRLPILEGNTERLFCRLLACENDSKASATQKTLWAFSESLLPKYSVGDFNQALMELGALVCTPKSPQCSRCPIQNNCLARLQQKVEKIPFKKSKLKYESIEEAVVVVRSRGFVLLRKSQRGERWAGMWDFPRFRIEKEQELAAQVVDDLGIEAQILTPLCVLQHAVTRFRITLQCFTAVVPKRVPAKSDVLEWFKISALPGIALNVTARKIANKIVEQK